MRLRLLPIVALAALAGQAAPAWAQSNPGFFPERYVACREAESTRRQAPPRSPPGSPSTPLPRRAAPAPLPIAPLVVIDVAVAEPVPTRPSVDSPPPAVEQVVIASAPQDWRCVGFPRGKAGILRVLRAPPLARFAGHTHGESWRLENARAASAAAFPEAVPELRRLLARPVPPSDEAPGGGPSKDGPALFHALDAKLNAARALGDLGDTPSARPFAQHLATREDRSYSLIWLDGLPPLAAMDAVLAERYAAEVVERVVRARKPTDPHAASDDTLLRAVLPMLRTPDPARLAMVRRLPNSDQRCDVVAARLRLGDAALRAELRPELDRDLRTQRGVACYSEIMPFVFPGEAPDEVATLLYRHRLDAIHDLLERARSVPASDAAWRRAKEELRTALTARSQDPDVAGGERDNRFQPVKRAQHFFALAELGDAAARAEVERLIADEKDEGVAPWVAASLALRFSWPNAADLAATRLGYARRTSTRRYDTDLEPMRGFVRIDDHMPVVDALAARKDPRFALGLLDRDRWVREATAVHVARVRSAAVCDVVTRAAPEAEEKAVQDAFWTLTMLGDACREQAHRLAVDAGAPPHVRGMALELLAMMRDPRTKPLLGDRGREDDIRPARQRARIIFHARE